MGGFLGDVLSKAAGYAGEVLPKIFSNELTEKFVRSGEAAVSRLGPGGEALVGSTKAMQDSSAAMAGQHYSDLLGVFRPFLKDKNITGDLATHWANHQNLPDGPLKDAITTAKIKRLQILGQFQKAGLKTGPLVQDDWPRIYPREMFEGVDRQRAVQALRKGGMTDRQAEAFLNNVSGKSGKAHNYESPRKWDLPGYRRDIGVLFEDVDKASKRLAFAQHFGPNEEMLDMAKDRIYQDTGSTGKTLADHYFDAIMKNGGHYKAPGKLEQGFASLQVASKLSLAVLSHTSQPLNVALYTGLRPMVKAMGEMVSELVDTGSVRSADDFALRSGATWTEAMRRYREMYGTEVGGLGSKVLKMTGFVSLDKYRRIFASVAGKHLAQDLFSDLSTGVRPGAAREKLESMGIDVAKALERGSLSEDDLLQAAKRTSDVTQFTFDANQLPMAWKTSPGARTILQFKQYFYAQSKFIKDFALKPAYEYMRSGGASGDIKPLIYTALLFPSAGEVTSDLREYARKGTLEERPQYPLERVLDNMAHAGAFGITQDLIYNVASPSDKPIWHFVAGPTVSDVIDLARLPHTHQPLWLELDVSQSLGRMQP